VSTVTSETRYADSDGVSIAYRVREGPGPDLLFVPGFVSHLDLWNDEPVPERIFGPLSSFSRLITFDKRGTCLSDRDAGDPTLDARMDDIRAVMDAAGSKRAALLGVSEGGPMAAMFAATYPERT
jgi:pimeloyl-ACP methyl ester carboxylesterase